MSNNFTQFSFAFDATPDQAAWLAAVHDACANEGKPEALPHWPSFDALQILMDQCAAGDLVASVDIAYASGELWLHASDCGDVEYTAELLTGFLEAFDLPTVLSFTWANTCSAMRCGEFDGGAAVITKREIRWLSPSRWIDQQTIEIARDTTYFVRTDA